MMTLRKATLADMQNIKDLYSHYILKSNTTWQRKDRPLSYYEKWFEGHGKMHPIFIAEINGAFVGFGCLSAFRGVCGYDKTCENTLYLLPQYAGKGCGKIIMEKLLSEAKSLGYWMMTAWIDSENKSSIDFHIKYGFYVVGEMKNIGNKSKTRRSVTILQRDFEN